MVNVLMPKFRTTPILVTGAHRSGTTWVGKMLALSRYVFYLQEPFNPPHTHISPALLPHQWYYIRPNGEDDEEPPIKAAMDKVIALHEPFNYSGLRYRFNDKFNFFKYTRRLVGLPRPLVKDPVAVFSAAWLAQTYQMDVICLIRHPAAFVLSLIKADWPPEFESLLAQPALMEDYLHPFRAQMENPPQLLVERAALLWTLIYYVLSSYLDQHHQWLVMRLEDIANHPIMGFDKLFHYLGLPYSRRIERIIDAYSNANNPIEAPPGNTGLIRRDSRASQQVWRERLQAAEIDAIRRITEPVSSRFYTDVDWL
ncbi:MAG: sulfotransferase [Ardenticatenaceae bacterium]